MVARARLRVLALALVLCSVALVASSSPASAGTYDVSFCTFATQDGLGFPSNPLGSGLAVRNNCGLPPASLVDLVDPNFGVLGSTRWTLTLPSPTLRIASLTADIAFAGPWQSNVTWALSAVDGTPNGTTLASFSGPATAGNPLPVEATRSFPTAGSSEIISTLTCPDPDPNGCAKSDLSVTFTHLEATIEDDLAPAVNGLGGSLVAGGTVSGSRTLTFGAGDVGSGVANVAVLVDGAVQDSFSDDNGGMCIRPYDFLRPCLLTENPSLTVNTALLPDGAHPVQAQAIDAAGNMMTSAPVTITTRNAPTSTAPPAIQGTPKLGSQLTATNGTWGGPSPASTFTYQWLRCPASVTSPAGAGGCTAIAGATSAQYTLTSADIYGRVIVKVTASNGSVTTTNAFSAPTAPIADANGRTTPPPGSGGGTNGGNGGGTTGTPDTTRPVLSAVSLTHTRFGVAKARTAIAALVRGTGLRLTSSEGGRLSIEIVRVGPGQKVHRSGKLVCTAVRRPVKRGRCTALTHVATLTRSIGAGRASVALSGRIGSKALAPGSYRLLLTVRDGAGNVSKAVQRPFTILRG